MAGTLQKFDFEEKWPLGLEIFVTTTPFMPSVATEDEIDWQIQALKDDLDAVARRMKKALAKRPKDMFGDTANA